MEDDDGEDAEFHAVVVPLSLIYDTKKVSSPYERRPQARL